MTRFELQTSGLEETTLPSEPQPTTIVAVFVSVAKISLVFEALFYALL